jgi:hypothetical protein
MTSSAPPQPASPSLEDDEELDDSIGSDIARDSTLNKTNKN